MLLRTVDREERTVPGIPRLLAAALLILPLQVFAELSIDELVAQTGIEIGKTPIRDSKRWQPPKKVIVRGPEDFVAELATEFPGLELVAASTNAQALAAASDADAIIGFCNPELASTAVRASWIQIFSAGAERCLAADAVGSGDIVLTNAQKMASPVIGEHSIAMTLALARGIPQFAKLMQDGKWDRDLSAAANVMPVAGKTMLVVGLGGIGREVAKRADALGMRVIATRNSSREGPDYVDYVGLSDELFELAGEADVIVNALPLTPATEGIFDAEFFAAAKTGTLFISVGRGRSTVTEDLMAALDSGQVGGAGLDVTDPEPLPSDHPLWGYANVIVTPHIAAWGGTSERRRALVRENLGRFVNGDALYNTVDPAEGY